MEFWEIITIGIYYNLVKTRFSEWIPENLHINNYTGIYYIVHMVLFTFLYPHIVVLLSFSTL